jgi:hypothetical protein
MIICIGGEPATGKTSLMKMVVEPLGPYQPFKFLRISGRYYSKYNLFLLGIYDSGTFQGTDRLSMAAPADLDLFLKKTSGNYLFEGDRFFASSCLQLFEKKDKDCKIFVLEVSEQEKKYRHIKRNDTQTESWLAGRKTKIENIKKSFKHETLRNETEEDLQENKNKILNLIFPAL